MNRPPVALARLSGFISDVDGVVLDAPHAKAWCLAVQDFATKRGERTPTGLDAATYQQHVAGLPRAAGARAALQILGIEACPEDVLQLCNMKQRKFEALIDGGGVRLYPDAVRLLGDCRASATSVALASASRNAARLLEKVTPQPGFAGTIEPICGEKPGIFIAAASHLGLPVDACAVLEDAPAGVCAAKAGGFACIGVARWENGDSLAAEGADLVIRSLDECPRFQPIA